MDTEVNHFLVWKSFKSGNKEALSTIFLSHYDILVNYGTRINNNEELVKDCIQDVFYKLWNQRENLQDVQYIKPYLLKILRRKMLDEIKIRNRAIKRLDCYSPDEEFSFSYEDLLIADEVDLQKKEKLLKCLNDLPKRQKEVIYLRFFENLDYERIACIMDLNIQSVRNLSFAAIKSMRTEIALIMPILLTFSN